MKNKLFFLVISIFAISATTMNADNAIDRESLVLNIYNIPTTIIRNVAFNENDVRKEWVYQVTVKDILAHNAMQIMDATKARWERDTQNTSASYRWRIVISDKNKCIYDLCIDSLNEVFSCNGVMYALPAKMGELLKEYRNIFVKLEDMDSNLQRESIKASKPAEDADR